MSSTFAYVGETRCRKTLERCRAEGFGTVIGRGRMNKTPLRSRRIAGRYFYESGAFEDFKAGRSHFDETTYLVEILNLADLPPEEQPDFAVLPDVVAGGLASLELSVRTLDRLENFGGGAGVKLPWALVVQDGMAADDLPWDRAWEVLFVGGSTQWKLDTASGWVREGALHGRAVHVGRVGSAARVRWARAIGATSIDSSLCLWSEAHLDRFARALREPLPEGLKSSAPPRAAPLRGALRPL